MLHLLAKGMTERGLDAVLVRDVIRVSRFVYAAKGVLAHEDFTHKSKNWVCSVINQALSDENSKLINMHIHVHTYTERKVALVTRSSSSGHTHSHSIGRIGTTQQYTRETSHPRKLTRQISFPHKCSVGVEGAQWVSGVLDLH